MSNYKKLGKYIQPVNIRNTELKVDTLLGVSIQKILMPSIANTVGTNMKTYKIIRRNQFAYGPVTSRNGDKISVALLQDYDEAIVSQAYTVFEVKDENELHPEYLMMWMRRPEFDRYARFKSHGSAREVFDWDELCETELPIPTIEKQLEIVKEYNTIVNRIRLNEQLNQKLEETAQALYKHWFVDFEFPNADGKPFKSSGGNMVYNAELDRDIPVGWKVILLKEATGLITKGTTPPKLSNIEFKCSVPYFKIQSIDASHFINPDLIEYVEKEVHQKELKRSIILKDDSLFSITGTLGEFAKATYEVVPANTNQNLAIIRLNQSVLSTNYLLWLFIGKWHKEFLIENTQDAVQANLNLTMIGNMRILKPLNIKNENYLLSIDKIINAKYNLHRTNVELKKARQLILSKMTKVQNA